MNSKSTPYGTKIPWYGYLMIFLLYATTFIIMTPLALLTGVFTTEEFALIFGNPLINILVFLVVGNQIFKSKTIMVSNKVYCIFD